LKNHQKAYSYLKKTLPNCWTGRNNREFQVIMQGPLVKFNKKGNHTYCFQLTPKTLVSYNTTKQPTLDNVSVEYPLDSIFAIQDLEDATEVKDMASDLWPFKICSTSHSSIVCASTAKIKRQWIHYISMAVWRTRCSSDYNGDVFQGLQFPNSTSGENKRNSPHRQSPNDSSVQRHTVIRTSSLVIKDDYSSFPAYLVEGIAPIFQQFKKGDVCTNLKCKAKFSLLTRVYHSNQCGHLFCDNCTKDKVILANIDSDTRVRVCKKCCEFIDRHKNNRLKRFSPTAKNPQRINGK